MHNKMGTIWELRLLRLGYNSRHCRLCICVFTRGTHDSRNKQKPNFLAFVWMIGSVCVFGDLFIKPSFEITTVKAKRMPRSPLAIFRHTHVKINKFHINLFNSKNKPLQWSGSADAYQRSCHRCCSETLAAAGRSCTCSSTWAWRSDCWSQCCGFGEAVAGRWGHCRWRPLQ